MSYNYRCSTRTCRKRITFGKPIEDYIRLKVCRGCGGNLRLDTKLKEMAQKRTCNCDGIDFPHSRGTEPWCKYAKVGPTQEDWEQRHGEY